MFSGCCDARAPAAPAPRAVVPTPRHFSVEVNAVCACANTDPVSVVCVGDMQEVERMPDSQVEVAFAASAVSTVASTLPLEY